MSQRKRNSEIKCYKNIICKGKTKADCAQSVLVPVNILPVLGAVVVLSVIKWQS